MEKISVTDLKEGMVVGEDVKDAGGQLLLPAGITIINKHLDVIQGWGITHVTIQKGDKEVEEEVPIDPSIVARAEKELIDVFRYVERGHPAMAELFKLCVTRRAKQMSQHT